MGVPIGSVWSPNTWADDAWGLGTWGDAIAPVLSDIPPSPTRLEHHHVNTVLALVGFENTLLDYAPCNTALAALDEDGFEMATPLRFTAGETGPITLSFTGADGSAEDLSTASAVTLRVVALNGTAVVDNVALTSRTALGTAVWTRTSIQVGTPGDYFYQARVTRADGTVGYYPDGQRGNPLTMLAAV